MYGTTTIGTVEHRWNGGGARKKGGGASERHAGKENCRRLVVLVNERVADVRLRTQEREVDRKSDTASTGGRKSLIGSELLITGEHKPRRRECERKSVMNNVTAARLWPCQVGECGGGVMSQWLSVRV
ncbi:hypothetical protein PIB30_003756 [Stylosanthes scabra]|uniref:Uncharacterized protein n=1 Tax=Stylosanthes scabra TaxID=79078 RepID=A0ABU6R2D4_9FABA|nr:hypothetical protein [Stylosanthes scabra]